MNYKIKVNKTTKSELVFIVEGNTGIEALQDAKSGCYLDVEEKEADNIQKLNIDWENAEVEILVDRLEGIIEY